MCACLPAWARPPDSEVVRVCVIEHAASLALASVVARVSGSSQEAGSRKGGFTYVPSKQAEAFIDLLRPVLGCTM